MTISRLQSGMKVERGTTQKETEDQVLREVYDFLELYGPSWYSEELRERLQAVLSRSRHARA